MKMSGREWQAWDRLPVLLQTNTGKKGLPKAVGGSVAVLKMIHCQV